MSAKIPSLVGTRARFQRLRDAKLFSGWVQDMTNARISIRSDEPLSVEPSDVVLFEVFGHALNLHCQATCTSTYGDVCSFAIVGAVRTTEPREPVRLTVSEYPCVATFDGTTHTACVVDISPNGVGLRSAEAIKRGTKVILQIETPAGPVACDGEVRYCRAPKEGPEFRIGVLIDFQDRINRARWWALFESVAA